MVYIVTSNGESVSVFSTKEKVINNMRYILDDDNGSGWSSDYYNDDFKEFIKNNYEIPIDGCLHAEGGVTYIWRSELN